MVHQLMDSNLRAVFNQYNRHFNEKTVKTTFLKMLKAVNFIHSKGIVHRDLRMNKFLVDFANVERGQHHDMDNRLRGIEVKLSDFGKSKIQIGYR